MKKLRMPTCSEVGHWFTDPVVRTKVYFHNLVGAFGWRFVVMVVFGEHLLKGFLNGGGTGGFFTIESRCYMELKIGAAERTILGAVSASPWSIKPIFGILSDTVIMWKMRRTQWVIITSVLALISYALILALQKSIPGTILAICFFFGRMQCSWTDLMVEAVYSEKIHVTPEYAADIVTWVWVGIGIGGLLAFVVLGACLDTLGPFVSVAIPLAVSGLPIIPAALGWMCEQPCTTPSCGIRWNIIKERRPYFCCGLVLFFAVLCSVAAGIARLSFMWKCVVACVDSIGVFIAAVYFLPHALWGPMLYMFTAHALSINTYGFVDNFYLDAADQAQSDALGYPICVDCPHFDNYFYVTVVGVVDMGFTAVGSWCFNAWISHWKYRSALCITQIILMLASIIDIIQFQRWNKAIGIPDWVFMLGKAAVQNTCSMLNFMPTTILIAKLCPVGNESTVFALLAGFSNYGATVSNYVGSYATTWIGLGDIGSGKYDDFSNAWIACLINACLPLLVLLSLPFLIPDARMTDSLIKLGKDIDEISKDGESQLGMSDGGNDLMDTEMEAGDFGDGHLPAPLPTPVMGFADDELRQTASNQHLMGEEDDTLEVH